MNVKCPSCGDYEVDMLQDNLDNLFAEEDFPDTFEYRRVFECINCGAVFYDAHEFSIKYLETKTTDEEW